MRVHQRVEEAGEGGTVASSGDKPLEFDRTDMGLSPGFVTS